MSWYCVHEKTWPGNLYEPPESWCEIDDDYTCENCPLRHSKDDEEWDQVDYEYDRHIDSFDF